MKIQVVGATGVIRDVEQFLQQLQLFSTKHNIILQVLNAEMIYGKDHVLSAADHAIRAFKEKRQSLDSLSLEILLYASGERQIKKAIKKMGIKQGKQQCAIVIIDVSGKRSSLTTIIKKMLETFHFIQDDTILEGNKETLKRFGISETELRTVSEKNYQDVILEKIAMVDVIK